MNTMAKILPSAPPFAAYRVYGPYLGMKGNKIRRMVTLTLQGKPSTTMTYARYLLCIGEGRWLSPDEEADHIDGDCLNDDPRNLRILTPLQNKQATATGRTLITLNCAGCGKTFARERRQTHLVKGGRFPTCCSRRCAKRVQFGKGSYPASAGDRLMSGLIA